MSGPSHSTLPRPTFDKAPRMLIVVSPYYRDIADQLLVGAKTEIETAGGTHEVAEVPGALEIPTTIGIAGRMGEFDGYVALGCVIRGETSHYDLICNESSRGLMQLGLAGYCIGNAILTVDTYAQAEVRAQAAGQNKGGGAAAAALHLVALTHRWTKFGKGIGFARERSGA